MILNNAPYNKHINTKDCVDNDSYLVYLKQDEIDYCNAYVNLLSEKINSFSSIKKEEIEWDAFLNGFKVGKKNKIM